MLYQQ